MREILGKSIQDRINKLVYFGQGAVDKYVRSDLNRNEIVALLKYQPFFAARDVLDLGVGTGRTTRFLLPLAKHYECLDYSPAMVGYMHRVMPQVSARLGDIRDLRAFAANSFDFVLASNNVISAISLDDRITALQEIRRVLRPGGVCMFSGHNRNYRLALAGPRLEISRNPITQFRHVINYLRCWSNHSRVRSFRQVAEDHALLNDSGHDFSLLHLYVSRNFQIRQLSELGFSILDIFDVAGIGLTDHDDDSRSASLIYVAIAAKPSVPERDADTP